MILVDTSVWVAHLRSNLPALRDLLEEEQALIHPHVIGEIACGNIPDRRGMLELLGALPQVTQASDAEALECVSIRRLHGRGLGWVDVHLLASALLTGSGLWTLDTALAREAGRCGVTLA